MVRIMTTEVWQVKNPGKCAVCGNPIYMYDPTKPPVHEGCKAAGLVEEETESEE